MRTPTTSRVWRLAAHPAAMVGPEHFALDETPLPALAEDQVLVSMRLLAFEPAMRGWITGRDTYTRGVQVGDVMPSMGVGEVVASTTPSLPVGTMVHGFTGWREHAVLPGTGPLAPRAVPPGADPALMLSVLGMTGITAWIGMRLIGEISAGQTVVVSGAAGATGSVAGQLARLSGCRVIGIAGGPSKCAWLTEGAGFDEAIDYKAENVGRRVRELCPQGVDVYYDNVGGEMLDAVLVNLAMGARVVVCGAISGYNDPGGRPAYGLRNHSMLIIQRARMEGFIIMDHAARFGEAAAELSKHVRAGDIAWRHDVQTGFDNAPKTLTRLFTGANQGKQLLEL